MFANTYVCESTLSTIKQVKSENVNRMVYETVDHSIHFAPLTQWRNHMLLRHHFWHISQHIFNVMVMEVYTVLGGLHLHCSADPDVHCCQRNSESDPYMFLPCVRLHNLFCR